MPHAVSASSDVDTGLACVVLLARFFGLPVDPNQLQHQFGQSGRLFDAADILLAAKHLGLKAKAIESSWARLADTPLPAIAQHHDGHYFIVAKIDGDKALIQDPLEQRPLILPHEIFEKAWCGKLILFTRRAKLAESGVGKFDFTWFIPAIIKHRRLFGEVLLASFFIQLFALVTPLFFQVVIDKVLVHKGLTTLDVLLFGLVVISLFEVVLGGLRTYLYSHTAHRIDVSLGAKLFRHMLALPLAYFEARRVGDTVARVRELESIRQFLTGSALAVVVDAFFTVVFIAVMYYYSPLLTWIVLGSIPLYALLSVLVTPVLRARLHEKFNRGAENQAFLVESINGVQTLKAMAVEPQMQRRFEEQLAGYVRAGFRADMLGNTASQIASLINKLVVAATLWFGAHLVIEGSLSVGQLVAFNMLAARVSGPVLRLVQLWQDFQQAGISVQRLGDILNAHPEPGYNPNRATLPAFAGRVIIDNITFRYRPDTPEVLRRVSLDVQPGEVIGIVGRSGSGKSTLTKLIQRLYVPESGRILIDGVDLAMVEPAWLRRQIGVVLQENMLFNRTVRDNIALADPGLPMEAVIEAAKLSGGQRQRIAIARALVTHPRILIFDEATSALDYESERIIHDNMKAICQGRTVFIIAHRLNAVRHADRIIVIDKGEIVEQGSHGELLQHGGEYAKLHRLQAGD